MGEVINEINNEPEIAKMLAKKLVCHIRRTDPDEENDFSECGDDCKLSSYDKNYEFHQAMDVDRNLWRLSYAFLICIVCYFRTKLKRITELCFSSRSDNTRFQNKRLNIKRSDSRFAK